jgi:hypothetical protein
LPILSSHFNQLNHDLSEFSRFQNNARNASAIKSDLSDRFLLRCDYCLDGNQLYRDSSLADKPRIRESFQASQARTYCFNCTSVFCEACFRRVHRDECDTVHTAIPLTNMQDLPCMQHRNLLQFYSATNKRLVCSDCIIRAEGCTDFVVGLRAMHLAIYSLIRIK